MWDWIRGVLIPGIYEDRKDVAMSNSTPYIGDGDAVLVGMPRLRQLRVRKGTTTDLLKVTASECFRNKYLRQRNCGCQLVGQ